MDPNLPKKDIKKEVSQSLPAAGLSSKDLKSALIPPRLGSSSRLPSFKGPRDLTLSALSPSSSGIQSQSARPKKTFVPNIPLRRGKVEKVVDSKSEKSTKKTANRSKPEHGKGRGRGKEREYVQTKGSLFGEGIASAPLRRSNAAYGGYGAGGGGGGGGGGGKIGEMQKPVLNTEAAYNVDKDLEDKKLKEILRDDFLADDDDVSPIDLLPVQLPMIVKTEAAIKDQNLKVDKEEEEGSDQAAPGVKVKQEPGTENGSAATDDANGLLQPDALFSRTPTLRNSVAHVLSNANNELMFFQLPSCLPGHPPEVKVETQPVASGQGKEQNPASDEGARPKPPLCTLDSVPEGQIGTLKIYESGKVELCLGKHNLEISKGTEVGFLQDVVRVDVNPSEKSGSMVVLGHINDRFVCTPDFNSLTASIKNL